MHLIAGLPRMGSTPSGRMPAFCRVCEEQCVCGGGSPIDWTVRYAIHGQATQDGDHAQQAHAGVPRKCGLGVGGRWVSGRWGVHARHMAAVHCALLAARTEASQGGGLAQAATCRRSARAHMCSFMYSSMCSPPNLTKQFVTGAGQACMDPPVCRPAPGRPAPAPESPPAFRSQT